ncbi:MAG: hypothetical protein DDT30_02059 [Dehalococcoidia bacterium]|nr:hypothetical protein [Bacillota bacterium]
MQVNAGMVIEALVLNCYKGFLQLQRDFFQRHGKAVFFKARGNYDIVSVVEGAG